MLAALLAFQGLSLRALARQSTGYSRTSYAAMLRASAASPRNSFRASSPGAE
ncbi:hypothetical protein NKH77_55890 [Streptomyces sp. M19]